MDCPLLSPLLVARHVLRAFSPKPLLVLAVFALAAVAAHAQSITWPSGCNAKTVCLNPGQCAVGNAFFTEKAETNCQAGAYLSYLYRLDLNNDGSIDMQAPKDTFQSSLPKGTHRLSWRVSDNCGNVGTCSYTVQVKDCQPPNLLCINGLTQPVALPNCEATFLANQFILSLSDNCTSTNQIEIGMREEGKGTGFPTATSISFDKCRKGFHGLEIWVRDQGGLTNICNTYVIVQESGTDCPCILDGDIRVSGCAETRTGQAMHGFALKGAVKSTGNAAPAVQLKIASPPLDSCYAQVVAPKMPIGNSYRLQITAHKNIAPLNGVSTYDLVLISKHILGLEPLPSFYQALAADANRSNTITTYDIVELRKLILGIYDTLPAAESWRFVRPVPNPQAYTLLELAQDTFWADVTNLQDDVSLTQVDFVAIKTGDLNNSAYASTGAPAEDRDAPPLLPIWIAEKTLQPGAALQVPLYWGETCSLSGWQFAATFDPDHLALTDVEGLEPEDYRYTPDGRFRALRCDARGQAYDPHTPFAILHFQVLASGSLSGHIRLQPQALAPEAYAPDGERKRLALHYTGAAPGQGGLQVAAPLPNPTAGPLTFPIALREAADLSLTLWDAQG
ncbi:MAG TPA: hypothetical protein PKD78_05670, partial [Saprospiraceae bacterium]|nr:hypothetical protein [Saprospiraceae bacterium]